MSRFVFLDRKSFWTALKTAAVLSLMQILYSWVFTATRGVPDLIRFEEEILRQSGYDERETILISIDPVFIYFRNIIIPEETCYFLNKSEGQFGRSELFSPGKMAYIDESVRDSFYFDVPENDIRAKSILTRLRKFEGNSKNTLTEAPRIQQYHQGRHFSYHFDALFDSAAVESFGYRVSTFMIYLEGNVTGGGTHFPLLDTKFNSDDRCEIIDCSGDHNGTTFRPIPGNALFWMNVQGDGRQYPATHAGLPVHSGVKTIWNIWLWQHWSRVPVWLI